MARFLIEIPDEQAYQLSEAFAKQFNYQETILDDEGNSLPNPKSKNEFWTDKTAQFWQDVLTAYRNAEAARIALEAQMQLQPLQVQLTATAIE